MRILMLSQFYPPIIGGGAIHARSLGIELASRGHDVAAVTLKHEGQGEFELDHGVRVYRIRSSMQHVPGLFSSNSRQYAPPFPDPEATLALRHILKKEQPEIVHAHNWFVYSFLPLKTWSGSQLVVTLHNSGLVCVKTSFLYRGSRCSGPALRKCLDCAIQYYGPAKGIPTVLSHRMMDLAMRRVVDMFLPVSQAVAMNNGLIGSQLPFQVIPNFIPDDITMLQGDFNSYLKQLPAEDYILFIGALNRQKGVDVMLRAYAGLTNAPPLVLIGYESPDWSTLSEHCPANVFVFKNWPRYAVMQALRRSIMTLLPSVGPESCPTAVMEAMASGCPVIGSCIGGIPDLIVDGETGFLVEPGDPSALQHAIERVLSDSDLRRRMGQAALRKVVEFQASTVLPRIEHVYENLLQQAKGSWKSDVQSDSVATGGAI